MKKIKHYKVQPKAKCWYVRTDKGHVEGEHPMTYSEALLIADFLVANKHLGVEIYRGQPSIFTSDINCP